MCEDYCNNFNKIHKITFRVLSLNVSTPGLKGTPFTTIYRSDFFIHTYNTYVKASDETCYGSFSRFPNLPAIFDICKVGKSGETDPSQGRTIIFGSPQNSLSDKAFQIDVENDGKPIGYCIASSSDFPQITDENKKEKDHSHYLLFDEQGQKVGQLSLYALFETSPSFFMIHDNGNSGGMLKQTKFE